MICYDTSLDSGEIGAVTVTVKVSDTTGGGSYLINEATIESLETEVDFSDIEITNILAAAGCKVQLTDLEPLPRELFPDTVHYPYQYWILNAGNLTGTVTLTAQCPLGWPVRPYPVKTATYPVTVALSPGGSVYTGSAVIVSNEWLSGTQCPVEITAALACPLVSEMVTYTKSITTTTQRTVGIEISPGTSKSTQMGTAMPFTHFVTNRGNWTDTLVFKCKFDPYLVMCTPPAPVTVAKQESVPVAIVLTDTGYGTYIPVTIVVSSTAGDLAWTTDILIVDHLHEIYLPLVLRNYPPVSNLSTSKKKIAWDLDGTQVNLTFTISLTNTGNLTATDLLLVDPIPNGTTYQPGSITSAPALNCEYQPAEDQIRCDGSLGIGENAIISFKAQANDDNICSVANTASVDDGFHSRFPLEASVNLVPPLPLVLNGTFESGQFPPCWSETGAIARAVVAPSADPSYSCFDSFAARLGNPTYSDVPIGNGSIHQSVTLEPSTSPRLEFDYCMFSYDIQQNCANERLFDTFEVAVNDVNNFIFRTGNLACTPVGLWSSGTVHQPVDLSAFAGQTITLYFSVWNRVDSKYNTWVYLDNVRVVP